MSRVYDTEHGEPAPIPNDGESMHTLAIGHINAAMLRGFNSGELPDEELGPIQGVMEELVARKLMGLKKYGTILQAHNGRNSTRDALDEALDLIVYICQMVQEGKFPHGVNGESMYRNACEFAIALKYILIQEQKKNDDASGRIAETGSPDLAGGQHPVVQEVPGQEAS